MSLSQRVLSQAVATALLVVCAGAAPASASPATPAVAGESSSSVVTAPTPPSTAGPAARAVWEALMNRDGEYAALAEYAAVIERYGRVEPFMSIAASEERHVNALVRQLDRLGVAVPANPYVGAIPAADTLQAAARKGAEGEVANVALFDRLLTSAAGDPGVVRVFTNLRRASLDQHLPAFQAAAADGGTLAARPVGRGGRAGRATAATSRRGQHGAPRREAPGRGDCLLQSRRTSST
ncbi:hypothetical protein [Mobilicoccus sp.]|uniref:ferritin-like domain-containing protein n=1 Tax=Mobilicoccus sp. TaxID=2034349 RepID=UPI0028ADF530|nr:hypothetical protein [Mobilicoccus sp.]